MGLRPRLVPPGYRGGGLSELKKTMICPEAEELFEEYYAAVESPAPPGDPAAARRIRKAIRMLSRHNVRHRCCVTLRFETSTSSGFVWKFGSKGCPQGSH